jgi:mannose-6-phosphate isomerase
MKPYPMLMKPLLKARVWGGRELERFGKELPPGEKVGESWEVADLPKEIEEGRSRIVNGSWAGLTLREALRRDQALVLGRTPPADTGGFPLLIKYLDARANLSVQVHPTRDYVRDHPGTYLKREAWVILDAEPDAVLYIGLREDVSPERFRASIEEGSVLDDLVQIPARAGECHYLPGGTCHALGGGTIVAEVQTPSDTTFRVYDWGRKGRELHLDEAMECIRFHQSAHTATKPKESTEVGGVVSTVLLETDDFSIERIDIAPAGRCVVEERPAETPVVWMIVNGGGTFTGGGERVRLRTGATILIPATLTNGTGDLEPGTSVLRITPPSPIRGMIA